MSTHVALERDSSNGATGAALRRRVRLVVAQNRVPSDEEVVGCDEDDPPRRGNAAPAYAHANVATPAHASAGAGCDVEDVRTLARAVDARLYDVFMKGDLPLDAAEPEPTAAANVSEIRPAQVQAPVPRPESQEHEAHVQSADPAEGDVDMLTEEDLQIVNASSEETPPAEPTPSTASPVKMPRVGVIRRLGPHGGAGSHRVGGEPRRRARASRAARARSRPTHDFAAPRPTPLWRMRRTDVMNGLRQLGIGLLIVAMGTGVAVLLT